VRVCLPDGGRLAATDTSNDRIRFFSPSDLDAQSDRYNYAFRSIGRRDTAPGDFDRPEGLATDGTHLFVADSGNHRVQQLRISDGRSVDSIGEQGDEPGQLCFPVGLALVCGSEHGGSSGVLPSNRELAVGNSDRLYVADRGNHRICVFGVSPLRYLTSFGQQGNFPCYFMFPAGLAVHAGCLYVADLFNRRVQVADLFNRRVQVLTLDGGFVRAFKV